MATKGEGCACWWDLTQHLTTRADDSHAAPVRQALAGTYISRVRGPPMSSPGKVLRALRRIKTTCSTACAGPPSIPLSFNLVAALPRRCAYRVSYDTEQPGCPTSSTSFTRRGLPGVSNPVCSPRFRASASASDQVAAFATGVLPNIYEFHLYTGNSTTLFRTQAWHMYQAQPPG